MDLKAVDLSGFWFGVAGFLAWKGRESAFASKWGSFPPGSSSLEVRFFSALLAVIILTCQES